MLSNLESRVCVVSKLPLCPGRGEPSSDAGSSFLCCCSVFIGALRFCFTGDELRIETTTRLCWGGFYVQGSGKGTGTGCSVTTVRGWESSWVWPLQRLELGARLSWGSQLCRFKDFSGCSAPCSWFPQNNLGFLSYLALLVFAQFFSACLAFFWNLFFLLFLYSDYQTQGSCYECLWVLLPSDWWADEEFLHGGVNVIEKGTVKWAWWFRSRAGSWRLYPRPPGFCLVPGPCLFFILCSQVRWDMSKVSLMVLVITADRFASSYIDLNSAFRLNSERQWMVQWNSGSGLVAFRWKVEIWCS